jgi:hypothetical protein
MPSRLDWSPVKVGNLYLRGSIFSPIGNCNKYVVAPVTRYTFKSGAGSNTGPETRPNRIRNIHFESGVYRCFAQLPDARTKVQTT